MEAVVAAGQQALRLVYHPAGPDARLRTAVEDLQAGRWMAMRTLLTETGNDWALRTARSQVLAAAAARSHAVRQWQREEPNSGDAQMMGARVDVERALLAHRRQLANRRVLLEAARASCLRVTHRLPADPVPWVCLLALAQADPRQRLAEHRLPAREPMLPPGPWGLLYEVLRRDHDNREAAHRMLRFWLVRENGSLADAFDFARWVVSWAADGSPLLILPLYVFVEHYRQQRDGARLDPLMRRQWIHEHVARQTRQALERWFDHPAPVPRAPLDLNHLAHALWAGARFEDAARVFEEIGPHATRAPWALIAETAGEAEREFRWARAQCVPTD